MPRRQVLCHWLTSVMKDLSDARGARPMSTQTSHGFKKDAKRSAICVYSRMMYQPATSVQLMSLARDWTGRGALSFSTAPMISKLPKDLAFDHQCSQHTSLCSTAASTPTKRASSTKVFSPSSPVLNHYQFLSRHASVSQHMT